MTTEHDLLRELRSRNIRIWVDGAELRFSAPRGAMTVELKRQLTESKPGLLSLLRESPAEAQMSEADAFPLTELQEAYLVGQSLFGELGAQPALIYLEFDFDEIDVDRLEQVARILVARHPALRAVVTPDGRQSLRTHSEIWRIGRRDLRCATSVELDGEVQRIRADLHERVDPFSGVMVAAEARRSSTGWTLCVCASLMSIDGASLRVLLEEGVILYRDLSAALPRAGLGYRDLVEALQKHRSPEAAAEALAYWRARLSRLPGAPELPLVHVGARPQRPFTRRTTRLGNDAWRAFKAQSRDAGVTAGAALCTAFAFTLATWSRHPHFAVTFMYMNRPPIHPDVGRVVGTFASTVLLEVDLRALTTFDAASRGLQRQLLDDLDYAQVSGIAVGRELSRRERCAPRPRAPVVFACALDSPGAQKLGWLDHLSFGALHTPHVWLDHQVIEDGGTVSLNWDAVESLFPPGTLDDAFAAYEKLVRELASSRAAWTQAPRLVHEAHLGLVARVNATEQPGEPTTLWGLVELACSRFGLREAVASERRRLTYAELLAESTAIAHWLVAQGARAGQLVAVVMEKGWEQVVAVSAVARSGAAYLPIDPSLPAARIQWLLAQCSPEIALTQRHLKNALWWPERFPRLCVDEPVVEPTIECAPPASPAPDDLAYVIFTSGSTGTPKGVMITHRGAVNTIRDINHRFAVGEGDKVLAVSSLGFDLSVYDIFGLLAAGGTVVLPPCSSVDPALWLDCAARERVTIWNSVPSLAQLLVQAAHDDGPSPSDLRLFLLSGDWVPVRLPDALRGLAPLSEVMSLGGATEASIWSIAHPTDALDPSASSVPYGKPLANQKVLVLDHALEVRPVWVPGEIYIGGVGVAQGYWRDPARTAERFVVHPVTGERLYRTGDIGRLLPDGAIEFLGREDTQVKVNGYRIELGEIESALERDPAVLAAAVVAHGDRGAGRSLVAHVTSRDPSSPPTAACLRATLSLQLPGYMVPTRIVVEDALPLTPNGKVDRGLLSKLGRAEAPAFTEPHDPLERVLAALWCELLGVDRVGRLDDFFALGGSSLLAVRLMAAVGARFGRTVTLASIVANPTLEALAALLRGARTDADSSIVEMSPPAAAVDSGAFILVHPVGGQVVCYRALAAQLGRLRPVYGVQAADGADVPETLPEMAREYARQLMASPASEPYAVGGWSLGGFLAIETARCLRSSGKRVDLVFALDSRLPLPGTSGIERAPLLVRFVADLQGRTEESSVRLAALLSEVPADEAVLVAYRWALSRSVLPAELSVAAFERMFRVFERNARALAIHTPCGSEAHLLSFHADTVTPGFGPAVDGRFLEHLPGDHYAIVQPERIPAVVSRIRAVLGGARS